MALMLLDLRSEGAMRVDFCAPVEGGEEKDKDLRGGKRECWEGGREGEREGGERRVSWGWRGERGGPHGRRRQSICAKAKEQDTKHI